MPVPLHERVKRRVRSVLIGGAIRLLRQLPLRPALALGAWVGRLAHLLAVRPRRRALRQLALCLPERTEAERRAIVRRMFVHLGRDAFELAAIRSCDARLAARVEVSPPTLLQEVIARGRGMVLVAGHLGSWALLARRVARAGIPTALIAHAGPDAGLTALAERFLAEGGVTTLRGEDPETGRAIVRTFRRGRALGLLIDQDAGVQGVFVPFFGRPAWTPRTAADLAIRFGAPVVVGTIHRRGPRPEDGHLLEVVEVPFSTDPPDQEAEAVRLTAACSAVLEAAIRRHPDQWVWLHERWRTQPGGEHPAETHLARPVPKSSGLSAG